MRSIFNEAFEILIEVVAVEVEPTMSVDLEPMSGLMYYHGDGHLILGVYKANVWVEGDSPVGFGQPLKIIDYSRFHARLHSGGLIFLRTNSIS